MGGADACPRLFRPWCDPARASRLRTACRRPSLLGAGEQAPRDGRGEGQGLARWEPVEHQLFGNESGLSDLSERTSDRLFKLVAWARWSRRQGSCRYAN